MTRLRRFIHPLAILTCALILSAAPAAQAGPYFALCWGMKELNKNSDLVDSPFTNLTMFYYLNEENRGNIARAKERLDAQPEGRRTIFDWNVNRRLYKHPDDKIKTASGEAVTAYWWENGQRDAEEQYEAFFSAYREAGGKLDYFITDLEHAPGSDLKKPEHWEAAAADPRIADILKTVGGANVEELRKDRTLPWFRMLRYGNLLMSQRLDRLHAIVRKHFPRVKSSDYSGYYDRFNLPYAWAPAPELGEFPGSEGSHTGTHQSRNLYGVITYLAVKDFDGQVFGLGPFRSLVYAVNEMRSSILSSPVPVMPWIAWRGYQSDFLKSAKPPPVSTFGKTDYWQESVFHAALCNPAHFLVWSAFRWRADQEATDWCTTEDLAVIDAVLGQLNGLVGRGERSTLVKALSGWYDPFILTGMNAGERSLWRFTPDPTAVKDSASSIRSREPLVFSCGQSTIAIPGGKIVEPAVPLSAAGFWIAAPKNAVPVITPKAR